MSLALERLLEERDRGGRILLRDDRGEVVERGRIVGRILQSFAEVLLGLVELAEVFVQDSAEEVGLRRLRIERGGALGRGDAERVGRLDGAVELSGGEVDPGRDEA